MFPRWDMQTHDFFLIKEGMLQNSIYTSNTNPNVNCSVTVAQSCLTLHPHGPQSTRLLCPWDSPGKNWSGLPFPSPADLPNPGLNPALRLCRQLLYSLRHRGKPCELQESN